MATHSPSALIAADIERDAGMTNPGTSAGLPGTLCQMFDNQIAQLEKLKETTLRSDQELRSRIASLEQGIRERDEKIRSLEQDNIFLKQGNVQGEGVSQPSSGLTVMDQAEDWKVKYEDMRKENENLQKKLNHIQAGWRCSHCNARLETQVTDEEDQPVTMDHKLYMSNKVSGNKFKHVLRHLSVTDTDVTNIYDAHPKDPKECCIQGLKKWKENKGKEATVLALIQGLLKAGLRCVAEEFCVDHDLHKLHKKIGQLENALHPSVVTPEKEKEDDFGYDFTDAPSSPPACPPDASPLQGILWPHLRHHNCLEDLEQDLSECAAFTEEQLKKLTKSKIFQNNSQRHQFLETCGPGNTLDVLNEWASRSSSAQNRDQLPVMMRLGKLLRKLGRKDIRKVLICFLHNGQIGPCMDEKKYIRDLSYRTLNKIGTELSQPQPNNKHDWRCFASDIGHSDTIGLLEKKDLPGMEILKVWQTGNDATVGKLYEWVVKETRWDIVKIMEEDMS